MIVLVMGVAGAGKTTVGRALAQKLGWEFADADDFHSAANIAKMRSGIALSDEDRAPWLESLRQSILQWLSNRNNVVLACSALKASYRSRLLVSPEVRLVYLQIDSELAAKRLSQRLNSFFDSQLLLSQFETLEEPQDALTVDASLPVNEIVQKIYTQLGI